MLFNYDFKMYLQCKCKHNLKKICIFGLEHISIVNLVDIMQKDNNIILTAHSYFTGIYSLKLFCMFKFKTGSCVYYARNNDYQK